MADGGTITRGGEGTDILVCVHKADATFYYDEEVQTLFAYVDYPITLADNAWGMYQGIDLRGLGKEVRINRPNVKKQLRISRLMDKKPSFCGSVSSETYGSVGLKQRPIGMTQQKTLPTQSLARKITVLKKNLKKSGQDGGNWFVQRYHRYFPSD